MLQRHANEGESIAEAIRDCLDYGKNPEKTEDGKYISSYECDPATVATEFLLAKASYKAMTGREQKKGFDVLCYQIRQSFYPGEITPEEANRISYELAMHWTKGSQTGAADIIAISRGVVVKAIAIFVIPSLFGVDAIWIAPFVAEVITLVLAILLSKTNPIINQSSEQDFMCLFIHVSGQIFHSVIRKNCNNGFAFIFRAESKLFSCC